MPNKSVLEKEGHCKLESEKEINICKSIKLNNERCKNKAKPGYEVCGIHLKKTKDNNK